MIGHASTRTCSRGSHRCRVPLRRRGHLRRCWIMPSILLSALDVVHEARNQTLHLLQGIQHVSAVNSQDQPLQDPSGRNRFSRRHDEVAAEACLQSLHLLRQLLQERSGLAQLHALLRQPPGRRPRASAAALPSLLAPLPAPSATRTAAAAPHPSAIFDMLAHAIESTSSLRLERLGTCLGFLV